MGVQGPLYQVNCSNMQELQGTFITQIPFTFCSKLYFRVLKILDNSFYIVAL
jgi:hypothetical protein